MKKIMLLLVIIFSVNAFGSYVPKEKALKMLKEANVETYSSINDIWITNDVTTLKKDGTGMEVSEYYRKVLTKAGQKDNVLVFNYSTNYNTLKVKEIKLIKKDGKVISFDPSKILQEKISGASQSANIYTTADKVVTGNIPNLEAGDILYYKVETGILKSAIEGEFSGQLYLEDTDKYLVQYTELNLPKEKTLHIHELNPKGNKYEQKIVENNGMKSYQWTIKDNYLVVNEPNIDDFSLSLNVLMFTTISSWEDISRWYYKLSLPHLKVDQDIKDKVAELTKEAKTRDEKISNIFYWVAKNIRYLGVDGEKNRPGLEPHDVTYTFKTRGGVCRDKATLLAAMLTEAGIESHPILIRAGSRLPKEVPVTWFNHAITVAYGLDGKPQYILDPTDETTKDFLPKYEEDNSYLIATEKGDTLRNIPTTDPKGNNSTIDVDLKLNENGDANGTITFKYTGVADNVIRQIAMSYSKDQFEKIVKTLSTNVDPSIIVKSMKYTDPRDKTEYYEIQTGVEIPNYVTKKGNYQFIPFKGADPSVHFMYNSFGSVFTLNDRKYNFKLESPTSLDVNYKVTFNNKLDNISIPTPKTVNNSGFESDFTSNITDKTLTTKFHFETKKIHFDKDEYQSLKADASKLSNNRGLYLIKRGEN